MECLPFLSLLISPREYAVIFYPSTLPFRKHVRSCGKNKSQALRFRCVHGIRKPTRKFSNQTCKSLGQIFSFVRVVVAGNWDG